MPTAERKERDGADPNEKRRRMRADHARRRAGDRSQRDEQATVLCERGAASARTRKGAS